jgi:hypothetical protein
MREESRDPDIPKYHYDREKRLASLPDRIRDRPKKKKGFLRGNRSLVITLIDVAFLVMLFAVFSIVSRFMGDNTVLPGYTVTAKASVFGERVLVSATVKARDAKEEAVLVRVRISYPEGGGRIELDDFLPAEDGAQQIYRGSLARDETQTQVEIDFFTDAARGSITTRIKDE